MAKAAAAAEKRRRSRSRGLAAALALCLAAGPPLPAAAQDASASDAPVHDLWNPVPASELKAFCTDRPTKSNFPCTVEAGHFMYEGDAINWAYARFGNLTANTYLFTNPTLKLGLSDTTDVELNIAPVARVTLHDSATGRRSDVAGPGDLFLRFKWNPIGYNGGDVQATLLPFVKVPTAKPGIGNKAVEGGLIGPVLFALPRDFTLVFDPEVDFLRNAANTGRHPNFQVLANLSRPIVENVTLYGELWAQVNKDPLDTRKQMSLDLAVTWLAWPDLPNLQLDAGVNIGLTRATPDLQVYIGVAQRF
jgi:hypothetical protein